MFKQPYWSFYVVRKGIPEPYCGGKKGIAKSLRSKWDMRDVEVMEVMK